MLFPTSPIATQHLVDDLFALKQVSLSVLRLDTLHPVISGNKLFKLHYFLETALQQSAKGIITFGGAYSNHLVATAFACKTIGLKCAGVVRGERPNHLSATLEACLDYGMDLQFISREAYDKKEQPFFLADWQPAFKHYQLIPEGGYHPLGAIGAAHIADLISEDTTHICCAAGTATTVGGLLMGLRQGQQVICIPVLKNLHDLPARIIFLTNQIFKSPQLEIWHHYHFGGYAKKTDELVNFMNWLYQKHQLPTDFVYTAKMMFGVMDCIRKDFFLRGSKIVCIHTGGLQGNVSLAPGTLLY